MVIIKLLTTSPVVSWRGWETPPTPSNITTQLSFFTQPPLSKDLSLRVVLPFVCIFVFRWWMDWCLFDFKLEYFLSFSLVMSRELRLCPGVGGRECGAFLSSLDRDPHPTCTRCRGRVCTRDLTCDICAEWSSAQWELFAKKRSYAESKRHSRPSGSVPPAPKTSLRARTS